MTVYGYIFLAHDRTQPVPEEEQLGALKEYANGIGLRLEKRVVEIGATLKRPFKERVMGGRLFQNCVPGDAILVQKAEWVLGSAGEAAKLLRMLRKNGVALHCVDLGCNISLDENRKLVVHDGYARIIQHLLSSLAVCESSKHGEAIKAAKRNQKEQGKYLGGPVPFGWQVSKEGFLVENREQQEIIAVIIGMREDRWSYRDISAKLKKEHGVRLSHEGVRRVLDNDKKKKKAAHHKVSPRPDR